MATSMSSLATRHRVIFGRRLSILESLHRFLENGHWAQTGHSLSCTIRCTAGHL